MVWTLPGRRVVPAVVPVVDVSASIDDPALTPAAALLARSLALPMAPPGRPPARLAVRRVDGAAGRATGELERFPGSAGWRSDLGLALGTGLAALDARRPGRILLLSDGLATQGALEPVVAALVDQGVSVWVRPLARRAVPAAAVTDLRAVGELRPGASFVLEAELRAARAGPGAAAADPRRRGRADHPGAGGHAGAGDHAASASSRRYRPNGACTGWRSPGRPA